ncbi:hypothetical protein Tco_0470827, partial [Tanacetum coccineum]
VLAYGSVPLKTYPPDGDIDLKSEPFARSVSLNNLHMRKSMLFIMDYSPPSVIKLEHDLNSEADCEIRCENLIFKEEKSTSKETDLKQMLMQSNSPVPPELARHEGSKFKPESIMDGGIRGKGTDMVMETNMRPSLDRYLAGLVDRPRMSFSTPHIKVYVHHSFISTSHAFFTQTSDSLVAAGPEQEIQSDASAEAYLNCLFTLINKDDHKTVFQNKLRLLVMHCIQSLEAYMRKYPRSYYRSYNSPTKDSRTLNRRNVQFSNSVYVCVFRRYPFRCNRGVWLLLKQYPNTPVAAERVLEHMNTISPIVPTNAKLLGMEYVLIVPTKFADMSWEEFSKRRFGVAKQCSTTKKGTHKNLLMLSSLQ